MGLILAVDWITWAPAIGTFIGGGLGLAAFVRQIQIQRQEVKNTAVANEAKAGSDKTAMALGALEKALERLETENERLVEKVDRQDAVIQQQDDRIRSQQNELERMGIRVERCDLEKASLMRKVDELMILLGQQP